MLSGLRPRQTSIIGTEEYGLKWSARIFYNYCCIANFYHEAQRSLGRARHEIRENLKSLRGIVPTTRGQRGDPLLRE